MSGIFNSAVFNNSVFNTGAAVVVISGDVPGGTTRRKKRQKWNTLRRANYQTDMEYVAAVKEALSMPLSRVDPAREPDETSDDEIILALVTKLLH